MALILVRIDDRLIHGQVTVGWAQALRPNRILLANDAAAMNPAQKSLYEASVQSDMAVSVLTIDESARECNNGTFDDEKTILVVESPEDVLLLLERGVDMSSVNIGGLHCHPGKRNLLDYVYVSEEDEQALRTLLAKGIEVECRDVPSAKKIDFRNLLQGQSA
jgi:PTS system mannose-specific IIB component